MMHLSSFLVLVLIKSVLSFVLEGSDVSFAKFRKWSANVDGNSSILLEFSTNQPDGLLLYTDDGGKDDFFELKLVEGTLRLRFNLGEGTQMMNVGRHLNDGLWHRAEIRLNLIECSLTVDGFVTQARGVKGRDGVFGGSHVIGGGGHVGGHVTGNVGGNSHVFIGGLPQYYNNRLGDLSLPSVVFEPRFRGAVRNLVYAGGEDNGGGGGGGGGIGIVRPQEFIEWKGLVSGPGEACERHDPCLHGGFCISTDSGPVCDCKHIDFDGPFCEKEKAAAEGTFRGGEWVGYDFRESGGEPIVSTLDEVAFLFKTKHGLHDGLLFYSGDGVDYLCLSLREGKITISINLGFRPMDARIHPDHLRFDDNQWHSVRVHRKVQEITASVDGLHSDRWTLSGNFTMLSSNRVTVGGFDMMRPLPGIKGVTNFVGCLRKVEYRADTLRLSLLELARAGNRLVSVTGRLVFQCQDEVDFDNNHSNKINPSSSENVLKTMSGGTVTFTTPDAFLMLPSWNGSRTGSLSLKIRTTEPNGLVLFAKSNKDGQTDTVGIDLQEGHLWVHLDLGTGPLRIQATSDPIDDGEWHLIKLIRSGRSGTINVDEVSTDFNTKGESTILDVDSPLFLGNVPSGMRYISNQIWSLNLKKGFVGCVRGLVINGGGVDLAAIAQQQDIGAVRPLCQVGSAGMCASNPCLNGGKCGDGWGRFVCDCYHTNYEGAVCQRETPTLVFDGSQFAQITNGSNLNEGVEAQDIVLRFKTNRPNGLLFSLMGLSSDFIEISMELTRIKLRVRLGDREKVIQMGRDLNDGHWHLVKASRRGNQIRLQIDDIPPSSGEILTRQWTMWPLKVQLSGLTNPFTGQMSQLTVNGLRIISGLKFGILKASYNAKIKSGLVINSAVSFKSKESFVGLPQLRAYSRTEIYFQFKTNEGGGVILYNGGNKKDYICVELVEGELVYSFDVGGGVQVVKSMVYGGGNSGGGGGSGGVEKGAGGYNDNRWHDVVVLFDAGDSARNSLTVDGDVWHLKNNKGGIGGGGGVNGGRFLDLNGVLYLGGVPENMYDNLPRSVRSRYGFLGCLSSLDLGGESLNPTTDALVPSNMVVAGCDDANQRCTSDSCSNGGTCVEQWSGPGCDCDMTSYTGPTCKQESISYDFGRGAVLFSYQEERRPDTRADVIAFGFLTADPDAVLVRIDSAKSTDYLEIELMDGKVRGSYNMGSREQSIGELSRRVNDRVYHVIRLTRSGSNATLQVDNWDSITRHPLHHHLMHSSVFNSQALIHLGGRWKPNKKNIDRPFQGVLSGVVVNGLRLLDMATDKDPRIRIVGQAHQITSIGSIPSSSLKDDLHYMQKTTASVYGGVNDDLVSSGESRCLDNEDDDDEDCRGVTSGDDELITPVYVPRPSRPTTTSSHTHSSTKKNHKIICDDEDCNFEGSGTTEIIEDTTPLVAITTATEEEEVTTDWTTENEIEVEKEPDLVKVTEEVTTSETTTSTRFIPPHPPSLTPYKPQGRDFDFDPNPSVTIATPNSNINAVVPVAPPPPTNKHKVNETIYLAEAGDSTLVIIIIIAVLMIIIVSILIIFFMCKRRDDPIYKVEDKGGSRFDFTAAQNPRQPILIQNQGGQGGVAGVGGVGGVGQGGPRKTGVKEWYV